jgi:hypothetical protein
MEPVPPLSIGGHIIAEFEDDAGAPAQGPGAVSVGAATVSAQAMPADVPPAYAPPSEEAAAEARRFWAEVIRRHTEAVPGIEGRLRVLDSAGPNRGVIVVEHVRAEDGAALVLRQGCELDVADAFCLTLVDRKGPVPLEGAPSSRQGIKESVTPIPWTEIRNIRFEVIRPLDPDAGTETAG